LPPRRRSAYHTGMKAAFFRSHGGTEEIAYGDLPDPRPGTAEVLVRVRVAGLNHLDLWTLRGLPGLELEMPHVGGSDFSGVIEEVGGGVEGWSAGDRVAVNPGLTCGECEFCRRGEDPLCVRYQIVGEHTPGGFAELAAVPARNLIALPPGVSFETGAAAPLAYQTAWRALIGRAKLRPDETVLVTGASGGVSTAGIQIAVDHGARVIAVTSGPTNVARAAALGAHVVVDRLKGNFSRRVWAETGNRGVDVVLDSVGTATWEQTLRTLGRGGRMVVYGGTTGGRGVVNIPRMFWMQTSVMGSTMANKSEFSAVMAKVFDGSLVPVVDDVLPLSRAREACERLENGGVFGKLLLSVGSDGA